MEPEAAALIGAGFACVGMGGAAVGLGHIFGNFLAGVFCIPFIQTCVSCGVNGY